MLAVEAVVDLARPLLAASWTNSTAAAADLLPGWPPVGRPGAR